MKNLNSEKPRLKGLSIISNNNVSKIYRELIQLVQREKAVLRG